MAKWFNNGSNKTDRELLEAIAKAVQDIDERLETLEEMFLDENGGNKELSELKKELREQSTFQRSMIMTLIENKKAADAKPTATELYMQQKKEREERERAEAEAKKNKSPNGSTKLPMLPG